MLGVIPWFEEPKIPLSFLGEGAAIHGFGIHAGEILEPVLSGVKMSPSGTTVI